MAETNPSSLIYEDVKRGMARMSYDKKFASALRRGAGRPPEQEPDAFAAVCENISDEFIAFSSKTLTVPQKAEYIALTLVAEAKADNGKMSFARAMGRLSKVDALSEQGVVNDFQKILRAKEMKELTVYLYGATKLLNSNNISFDHADFAANFLFGLLSQRSRDRTVMNSWEEFERGRRALQKKNTQTAE